ncbi:ABC transporter permease [Acidisoma cladoniae]|jgi:ribose transport system permease protein|uniref:ABC transporter permease n=1 Tax=Acidisoma cladoniae TaxID=3040935 RepID=UPI00254AD2B1|nr:ABC transporter permease [Acidisoma sp. PAMC 29798]
MVATSGSIDTSTRRGTALRGLFAKSWAGVAMLLIFYAALIVIFTSLSKWFLSFSNIASIGTNMAFIGLMAAAGTPLIISGGLDLSVAAVAGMAGVVVALLYGIGVNIWIACLAAIAVGSIIGLANGLLVTRGGLNPFIVTLGSMSIITGLSLVLTGGLTQPLLDDSFGWIGSGAIAGIPFPLILMVVVFIGFWWLLAWTPFGRRIYAVGGNPDASRLLGLPVERLQLVLYVVSGAFGALGGVVLAAMLGAAAPDAAGQSLLTVIAAIILGGTSLFGGRGSAWGTLLAVLILGTLNNGLTLLNVSSFWQQVTRGVVLLLAVGLDQVRVRMQSR